MIIFGINIVWLYWMAIRKGAAQPIIALERIEPSVLFGIESLVFAGQVAGIDVTGRKRQEIKNRAERGDK